MKLSSMVFLNTLLCVAPLTGAWIEILSCGCLQKEIVSLPSRERGLKSYMRMMYLGGITVAPLTGAWIEIEENGCKEKAQWSLPSRERGLK